MTQISVMGLNIHYPLVFLAEIVSFVTFQIVFSELSPVAAIVGGVLAQEVIKTVSKKDQPQNNFFLYNPIESSGSVEAVGY